MVYSINFSEGKEVAVILNSNEQKVTSIKIKNLPKGDKIPSEIRSKKDKRLVIFDNIFRLPDEGDFRLQFSPSRDEQQNNRVLIIGPSGSGKSTFAAKYIEQYKRKFKNEVFLFSRHAEDPSIDKVGPIRIDVTETDITESYVNKEAVVDNSSLANSLVVFDDIDMSSSKALTNYWYALASDLAQNARKLKIDLLFILHNTNYSKTRMLMSEASHFVFFLNAGSKSMYLRLMDQYLGIKDKKIRERLFAIDSRYIVFSNIAPLYILTEDTVMLMNNF